jgi:ABC-type transport system involved in multi-copper enzyme maturation permease subunit
MTIYGVGYRKLDYEPTGIGARIAPIVWNECRALFRPRFGVWAVYLTVLVCCFPFLLRIGILMVRMGIAQLGLDRGGGPFGPGGPRFTEPDVIDFYLYPVLAQSFFGFAVVSCIVSCRAIAKDRVTDALEIYWTRGITPAHYFVGKWLGSFALIGTMFIVFPLVIWLLAVFVAPDWGLLGATIGFLPRMLLAMVVFTALLAYLPVAFSALANGPNPATILWLVLLVGSEALAQVLSFALRGEWWYKAISPWESARRIAEWIAGISPSQDFSPWTALGFLGAYGVLLALWMRRRMRLVEAVS